MTAGDAGSGFSDGQVTVASALPVTSDADLNRASARILIAKLRQGQISACELMTACLDRSPPASRRSGHGLSSMPRARLSKQGWLTDNGRKGGRSVRCTAFQWV